MFICTYIIKTKKLITLIRLRIVCFDTLSRCVFSTLSNDMAQKNPLCWSGLRLANGHGVKSDLINSVTFNLISVACRQWIYFLSRQIKVF